MIRAGEEDAVPIEDSKDVSAAASTPDDTSTPPPVPSVPTGQGKDTSTPPVAERNGLLTNSSHSTFARVNVVPKVEDISDDLLIAKEEFSQGEIEMKEESQDENDEEPRSMAQESKAISPPSRNDLAGEGAVEVENASTAADKFARTNIPTDKVLELSEANNSAVVDSNRVGFAHQDQEKVTSRSVNVSTEASRPEDSKISEEGITAASSTFEAAPTKGYQKTGAQFAAESRSEAAVESPTTADALTELIEAPAETSSAGAKRNSAPLSSSETQQRARQDESLRIQRENEDMRLQWLSLPANDHITYYSDTEDDASSNQSDVNGIAPAGAFGGMPYHSGSNTRYSNNGKRNRQLFEEEKESSDSEDEIMDQETMRDEHQYRTGNRGNKLLKNSRWIRQGKLGLWTEAKTEKDYHDRFMTRIKAIQRAGVESLLHNAPGPKVIQEDGVVSKDLLEGSDRLLLRDVNRPIIMKDSLYSTSLAPALLRPILSAKALLESHTLRHTFRNPHIGALSKTALDLRESESQLAKALGRCFAAMERTSSYIEEAETNQMRVNGSQSMEEDIDANIIGAENTAGTADEVNPALYRLEDLFITKKGLPIPVTGAEGESQVLAPGESQAVLSTTDQRNVVRAALECLTDLAADSLEYVERLEEVRGRLESAKRQRTQVWEALRLWAIKREFGEEDEEDEIVEETNGAEPVISRSGGGNKQNIAGSTISSTSANKRRR